MIGYTQIVPQFILYRMALIRGQFRQKHADLEYRTGFQIYEDFKPLSVQHQYASACLKNHFHMKQVKNCHTSFPESQD